MIRIFRLCSISSCDSGYVHQQQHHHLQYRQQQNSSQHEVSPPVYTAADCRLLQQISNNAVTRNLNSPCQSTNTPPSTPTPSPNNPSATIQLSAPPTAAAYMHIRSQHQQLQQQQQSLIMPPPPPPPYNVPPLTSLYSQQQGNPGSRHLNHMHGKRNLADFMQSDRDQDPATNKCKAGAESGFSKISVTGILGGPPNFMDNTKCTICPMPPMNQ